jgi:hypothetical protein
VKEQIPVASAKLARQANGKTILVDATKCFGGGVYPCPGCSNCDRLVEWTDD